MKFLAQAGRWGGERVVERDDRDGHLALGVELALHLGAAVDDDIAEVAEDLGSAVALGDEAEELGGVVNEGGGGVAGDEGGVLDEVFEEGDVGLDAADAKFAKGTVGALDTLFQ
jgi:hypothetical protein